ncbi:hypothetical protein D3C86_1378430 [compost metagenome]
MIGSNPQVITRIQSQTEHREMIAVTRMFIGFDFLSVVRRKPVIRSDPQTVLFVFF